MKKFPFLLLDAGPIIKLFELGIWDEFLGHCDVTISKIVEGEAKWASRELEDIYIDLEPYQEKGLIDIVEVDFSVVKEFYDRFDLLYKSIIHDGEKEMLAFLYNSPKEGFVCSADKAVFRVLGAVGKGDRGISLEEVLK